MRNVLVAIIAGAVAGAAVCWCNRPAPDTRHWVTIPPTPTASADDGTPLTGDEIPVPGETFEENMARVKRTQDAVIREMEIEQASKDADARAAPGRPASSPRPGTP